MNDRAQKTPIVVKFGVGAGIGYALYRLLSWAGGIGAGTGRPRDAQPVLIRVRPADDPTRAVIEMEGRVVLVPDLVARIRAGGRQDVLVVVRGDTIQRAWDDVRVALELAGIQVVIRQAPIVPAPH